MYQIVVKEAATAVAEVSKEVVQGSIELTQDAISETAMVSLEGIDLTQEGTVLQPNIDFIKNYSLEAVEEINIVPSNSEVTINGERLRTDDYGKIHQRYNQETKCWELLPNNEYTVHGYDYKTNRSGEIIHVSGELREKTHEGRRPITDEIPNRLESDDRGHLIADMFDGSNQIDNIVPMDKEVNQRQYRAMEDKFREDLKLGKSVEVDISIKYDEAGRPTKFTVKSYIDGERQPKRVFLNENKNGGKEL